MDHPANTLDQADEEILTYTASDEALEAAAGMGGWQCKEHGTLSDALLSKPLRGSAADQRATDHSP
jgi:hypothetical protein